jgi:glycosyltransferase involved in cell wall biosynthesis
MKISIITVSYNSELTIRDTILSVLAQTHPDIEYIIVDGASTDGTLAIIEEYRTKITRVISEPDNGIYDAMNKGIREATGDFVGILNSDDFLADQDTIKDLVSFLQENPSLDCSYADVVYVQRENPEKITRFYSSKNFSPRKVRIGIMIPHAGFYAKRELFERFGYFKLGYRVAADFELMARFMKNGAIFGRYPQVMVKMRNGGISSNGFFWRIHQNFEIVRACKENGIYTNIVFLMLKIPSKLLSYICR